jgi:hypothetical protein
MAAFRHSAIGMSRALMPVFSYGSIPVELSGVFIAWKPRGKLENEPNPLTEREARGSFTKD